MSLRSFLRLGSLVLVTALIALAPQPATAEEPEKKSEAESDAKKAAPRGKVYGNADLKGETPAKSSSSTFTNEDLERMFGSAGADPAPDETNPGARPAPAGETKAVADQPPWNPLEQLQEQQKQAATRRTAIAEAEERVTAAEKRIVYLERRVLAVKNPFLARPKAPEDEKEKKDWDAMDEAQRASHSESELKQARGDLEKAKEELARLRRSN